MFNTNTKGEQRMCVARGQSFSKDFSTASACLKNRIHVLWSTIPLCQDSQSFKLYIFRLSISLFDSFCFFNYSWDFSFPVEQWLSVAVLYQAWLWIIFTTPQRLCGRVVKCLPPEPETQGLHPPPAFPGQVMSVREVVLGRLLCQAPGIYRGSGRLVYWGAVVGWCIEGQW